MAAGSIRLEPFDERHLDAVTEMVSDADVVRFTRLPEPVPSGLAKAWLRRYEAGREDGTREAFAAVEGADAFVGLGLAPVIDRGTLELELGYIVVPGARGRGVATEILCLLTDWAFSAVGALRIYLVIRVENHASHRVAERGGYHREGVMRSIHVKPGRRGDAALWSRLPSDPAPARPTTPSRERREP